MIKSKSNSNILLWIFGGLVAWFLLGSLVLGSAQDGLEKSQGKVWSKIDRGAELLPRVESIVQSEMKERKDLYQTIVDGRRDLETAKESNDLTGAVSALSSINRGLKVVVEDNSISAGLNDLQRDLITNTEGTINRITYARDNLIDAQAGYNSTRRLFPLNSMVAPKVEVLGSSSNPRQSLPKSTFQN